MSPDGLACWVIPAEFMDVNYGREIKKYLLDRVTLIRVHRFDADDLQFDNVLVSTSIIWFKNTQPVGDYSVEFTYGRSINKPISSHSVSTKTLGTVSKWNRYSTLSDRATRIKSETKLSDLFQIKRGVATGANDFFILTSGQIDRYNIPSELLTPILPSPRYLIDDEIFADDRGNPQIDRRLFLLTCKHQPEELSINYPDVWNYLKQGIDAGISARYLCSHRSLWYVQENRDPAIFICPYMGRNQSKDSKPFRFILNHSKAIAPNVYLMMYPKEYLSTLFATNPELPKYIWQALNSIPIESLINEGRVYGDGFHKLEPKELANAPADRLLKIIENYNQPTLV